MYKRISANEYQSLNNINKTIQPKQFLSPYNKKDLRTSVIFLKKNYCVNKQYKGAVFQNSPKPLTKCIYSNITKDYLNSRKKKFVKKELVPLRVNLKTNCITPMGNVENRLSEIYHSNVCENQNYNNKTNDTESNFASYGNLFELIPTLSYTQSKDSKNSKNNKINKNI